MPNIAELELSGVRVHLPDDIDPNDHDLVSAWLRANWDLVLDAAQMADPELMHVTDTSPITSGPPTVLPFKERP